ncbi:energy transducer TonB [Saccharobesus litoralis]|nr:energy transducer TonB [Saccharobesus litoralis]
MFSNFAGATESYTPKLLVKIVPTYPSQAQTEGIEGEAIVSFDISRTGETQNVKIYSSSPKLVFDASVINAVKKWKFMPIVKNGKSQNLKNYTYRITYNLKYGVSID